jgi:hypothetical protein
MIAGSFQTKVIVRSTNSDTVEGVAKVTFFEILYWSLHEDKRILFTKTVNIDSADAVFDVEISSDLKVTSPQTISVEVEFTERETKTVVSFLTSVNIDRYAYKTIVQGSDTFKPSENYNLTIRVVNRDGSPVGKLVPNFKSISLSVFQAPKGTKVKGSCDFSGICDFSEPGSLLPAKCGNVFASFFRQETDDTGTVNIAVPTRDTELMSLSVFSLG